MESLGSPRIVVVGDLILDRYIWGYAERISQEALATRSGKADQCRENRLGGAASVATMLRALDAQVAGRSAESVRLEKLHWHAR